MGAEHWAAISALAGVLQLFGFVIAALKLSFFAGKVVERVDDHERRLSTLEEER
jgi:uncharacterized membrane protein YciS (DUF1049 family)